MVFFLALRYIWAYNLKLEQKNKGDHRMNTKLIAWVKKNAVVCIAAVAALITSCIIPPDEAYLGYFDFKTLTCLFCTLAVVTALRNIRFFTLLAQKIVFVFQSTRKALLALLAITFIGSMLIANDMALLTFLPLGYFVLVSTGNRQYLAFTFIMQNIAANLGGMLTPFGNPQNLYLYSYFNIPTGEFVSIMLPPFLLSITLIGLSVFLLPDQPLKLNDPEDIKLPPIRTAIYLVLFALSIAIVFRFIPYQIGLAVVPVFLLFMDRKALQQVDYGLLFTFVFFFIFSGNLSRVDVVRNLLEPLLNTNTLLFSSLSCQFISNVPSAVLLSQFTQNYPALLVGVNIGGAGTLIASLASLITFKEFCRTQPDRKKQYIRLFSIFNFAFLGILLIFEHIILGI